MGLSTGIYGSGHLQHLQHTPICFRPTLCTVVHDPWHYCKKVATAAFISDHTLFSSLMQPFQLIFSWSQIFLYSFTFLYSYNQILNSSSNSFPRVMMQTHAANTCTIKKVFTGHFLTMFMLEITSFYDYSFSIHVYTLLFK